MKLPVPKTSLRWPLLVPVFGGVALHLYEALFASTPGANGFLLGLLAWSLSPFLIGLLLWRVGVSHALASGYSWASLVGALYVHYTVFIRPTGSTAALGLLFMPLWNLLVLGPVGMGLSWGLRSHTSGGGKSEA